MNVSDIEEVGLDNISDTYKTKNGIGLCFFDPFGETLKEFDSTTKIPVYPLEKVVRRFYVVKDDYNVVYNTITLKIASNSSNYLIKASTAEGADFTQIPNNNTVIDFFSKYPNGIIPLNLYIESVSTNLEEVSLFIDIEVK